MLIGLRWTESRVLHTACLEWALLRIYVAAEKLNGVTPNAIDGDMAGKATYAAVQIKQVDVSCRRVAHPFSPYFPPLTSKRGRMIPHQN
jgi:uncharacterized membrane protein